MSTLRNTLRELGNYPSAIFGLVIVLVLLGISAYTVITIPYDEAIRLWRGGEDVWYNYPKTAAPIWLNLFGGKARPETIVLSSEDEAAGKGTEAITEEMTDITWAYRFDYPYDDFPQELSLFFKAQYDQKAPHIALTWLTPDGREFYNH